MLHGTYMTIGTMGEIVPELAKKSRQVIATELQGHRHTADIDRPLSFQSTSDDIAALIEHLKIEQADVIGYSPGGALLCKPPSGTPRSCASWWSSRPPSRETAGAPRSSREWDRWVPRLRSR